MSELCPVYLNNSCVIKSLLTRHFNSKIFSLTVEQIENDYKKDCQGKIAQCSLNPPKVAEPQVESVKETKDEVKEEPQPVLESIGTKVSVHLCENPYLVKSDILVYPTNIVLTIDDPLLDRMSAGIIQQQCDKFQKPIKMGTVYVTTNGSDNTKVQAKKIFHSVVAGESRLVNEADIKLATRKALHLANQEKARNVVMLPPDCGTHDINDAARVHLSAIYTYLQAEKECNIKNIFVVMDDQESYDVYNEYYRRVFKK